MNAVMGRTLTMGGMFDSGSMAGSINETAEKKLKEVEVITDQRLIYVNVCCSWMWWTSA